MRRGLRRFGLVAAGLLLGLAVLLLLALRPPPPLARPEPGVRLADVTIVRPGLGREPRRSVIVTGDVIERIRDARPGEGDAFAGAYLLPGLTDMHVHFPPGVIPGQTELWAFLFLYHGVLAVRDAADVRGDATGPAREGIARGDFPGPRVFACGPLVDGEPAEWPNTLLARTPEEGRRAVAEVAARGFDCVKAYNELEAPVLAAIREAAAEHGLPVIGHVPKRVPYVEARLDDVQHLIGVAPPWQGEWPRFPFLLDKWLELNDARLEALIAAALQHGIANTPTLVTIDRMLAQEDAAGVRAESDARLLPRFYREVLWSPSGFATAGRVEPGGFASFHQVFAVMKRTVRRMHEAGVRLHTGSDTLISFIVPGAALHRELRLWVEAGIPPEQALAASTRVSPDFLGMPELGALREGSPADFLLFARDPSRDLEALDSLLGVVRGGRLYTREALDAQLARYRAHFDGALFDAMLTPVVRFMVRRAVRQ